MSAAAAADWTVTEPGVVDMPFDAYLADPVPGGSLSTSGAKTLLNKCPAVFAWERDHRRPDKAAFDFGHAAHALILGEGLPVRVIPDDVADVRGNWTTAAAKKLVAEARLAGETPIKPADWADVEAMAEALRAHPVASKLLSPDRGIPEQSMFWTDPDTGVWRRARLDQMPHPAVGRVIIADYKTCESAKPSACERAIANYGYNMQGAAYIDAVKALGLADDAAFLLIFQEKVAPYLITVAEMTANSLRIGRERNARALAIFRECTETNHWPAYVEGIALLDLPVWAERQHEEEMALS